MMQIQFLPYHSSFVVWTQRATLVVDLALIWWLWREILSGREVDAIDPMGSLAAFEIGLMLTLLVIAFSSAVATFPGEWQEDLLAKWDRPKWVVTAHDALFNAALDRVTSRRLPFSSTLILPGLNVYEGLGIDDPEKAKWHDFVFRARGRDLRGAIFDFATLPKVDFSGAQLQGASLVSAQLQGASFDGAQLQGGTLIQAQLPGASLISAQLQGAWLDGAQLQGASLWWAQLQGASLAGARLEGASLLWAQLQGASLDSAWLQGASLNFAQLQGAWLKSALLEGASLQFAQLQGVPLQLASLEATDLSGAYLWRTNRSEPPWTVSAIRMSGENWLPQWIDARAQRGGVIEGGRDPWDDKAYQALRSTIIESLPPGKFRDQALERIQVLDCSVPTFQSCDYLPPPVGAAWWRATQRDAVAWREALEKAARIDEEVYSVALANALKHLVCSGGDDAIHIFRGILRGGGPGFQNRLWVAGTAAFGLFDDLMNKESKDCPVAAALTDADRAELLQIKRLIEVDEAGKHP